MGTARKRTKTILALGLIALAASTAGGAEPPPPAEAVQGAAVMGATSPIIKVLREPGTLESLKQGDTLFVFTDQGNPVTTIAIKNVFSDEIHSEPIEEALAAKIRDSGTILIYSNVREYGEFIKAYLDGGEKAFRSFIAAHPASPLRAEAQKVADGIVYRPYKLRGTLEAFEEFIRQHPENAYLEQAVVRRDTLQFLPFKDIDKIGAYRQFVSRYPNNRFVLEAQRRVKDILASFEEIAIDQLAQASASTLGRKVKFKCHLHSLLPIFVSGSSVGKKTALFTSPRPSSDYLNLQVDGAGFILWKLFISREDAELVHLVQGADRSRMMTVFGQVFSNEGNSPWIDVLDLEEETD